MHWRKPFPPRSVHPSPIAELRMLILSSFHPEETLDSQPLEKPVETQEPAATIRPAAP